MLNDFAFVDCTLGAGFNACVAAMFGAETFLAHPAELRIKGLTFRAVAPGAVQWTALEEYGGSYSGAVLNGKTLNIKYFSFYGIHLSKTPFQYGTLILYDLSLFSHILDI